MAQNNSISIVLYIVSIVHLETVEIASVFAGKT